MWFRSFKGGLGSVCVQDIQRRLGALCMWFRSFTGAGFRTFKGRLGSACVQERTCRMLEIPK